MHEVVLKTERLCKSYRSFNALDNVDMTVYRGDVYGLIGRNGAERYTGCWDRTVREKRLS